MVDVGSATGSSTTLSGSGAIGSLQLNTNAQVALGIGTSAAIGSLTVTNGGVDIGSGAVYAVSANATNSDMIRLTAPAASGADIAIDAGSTLAIQLDPAASYATHSYTIIESVNGSRTGEFGTVTPLAPSLYYLTQTIGYGSNNVVLNLTRNMKPYAPFMTTYNQRQILGALRSLMLSNPMNPVYDGFVHIPIAEAYKAAKAADMLSGEIHGSLHSNMAQQSLSIHRALNLRSRHAISGTERSDVASNELIKYYMPATGNGKRPVFLSRVTGSYGKHKTDDNASQLDANQYTALFGGDIRLNQWRVGTVIGLGQSDWDVSELNSSADSNDYYLGFYASRAWQREKGTLGLQIDTTYAVSDIDTSRNVVLGALNENITGSYKADVTQINAELSYSLNWKRSKLEPYAHLGYINVSSDSFNESGGASALAVRKQRDEQFISTLGLRLVMPLSTTIEGSNAWADLGWQHTMGDLLTERNVRFVNTGSEFRIRGLTTERNSAVLSGGLHYRVNANTSIDAGINSTLSDDSVDVGGNLMATWKF